MLPDLQEFSDPYCYNWRGGRVEDRIRNGRFQTGQKRNRKQPTLLILSVSSLVYVQVIWSGAKAFQRISTPRPKNLTKGSIGVLVSPLSEFSSLPKT